MKIKYSLLIKISGMVLLIALGFYLAQFALDSDTIQSVVSRFGYIGAFALAVVSGFNVIVPIPIVAFVPLLLEVGLSFWPIIVIISLGMTFGDGIGFLVGMTGREAMHFESKETTFKWLNALRDKHKAVPLAVMFLYASFVPIPNEILVIPLAFLGYKAKHILITVFIGNFIFNTLFAYGLNKVFSVF